MMLKFALDRVVQCTELAEVSALPDWAEISLFNDNKSKSDNLRQLCTRQAMGRAHRDRTSSQISIRPTDRLI